MTMVHLGDVTRIDGHNVPVTDVVIGGSPCQDLSVANVVRDGLNGTRSGLFMEQVRIVKEMRDGDIRNGRPDEFIRPRFLVWENVPGSLSSPGGDHRGEDFRIVLEEIAKVKDPNAVIPRPKDGKWPSSGGIVGNGYSICWRILDLQFWGPTYFDDDGVPTKLGTPQRRRRISLVADFNSERGAFEVLLEQSSVPGNSEAIGRTRKKSSRDPKTGPDNAGNLAISLENHPNDSRIGIDPEGKVQTLSGRMGTGGNNTPMAMVAYGLEPGAAQRLNTEARITEELAPTIRAKMGDNQAAVAFRKTAHPQNSEQPQNYELTEKADTLNVFDNSEGRTPTLVAESTYRVRRLTPDECEILQGFPAGYTDIGEWIDSKGKTRQSSDSARYKALGNSIGIPVWKWVLKRISAQYERDATMASLFDGIGGFPLIWEQLNGPGTCLWASEIEEFCIAVTEKRINGKDVVDLRSEE